ncbi:hypothetical protein AHAS_Ahas06G0134400 [Arachis hypogaea]
MARDAGSKARSQGLTRCGCLREMRKRPKCNSGIWYVSRFVDNHNHDLLPAKFVAYLPSYRKIFDVDLAHMDSLRQVRISIPKIYESIVTQGGGFNLVSFTKRDMYNESLILQRWSKTAKLHVMEPSIVNKGDAIALYKSRVGVFLHHCKRFTAVASMKDKDFKVYLEKVVRDTVVLELKNEVGRSDGGENNNLEQDVVHDSVDVRIKGTCHAHDPLGSRE